MIVKVRDNGRGIPESVDWKHAESLGLHLVQMLTRQLKGTIDLSTGERYGIHPHHSHCSREAWLYDKGIHSCS